MNIFYLSSDPVEAAQMQCDKHVNKMLLETAQMLCTAHRELDGDDVDPVLYRSTHKNHPSAVWVRSTNNNYNWAYCHMIALAKEYEFRYGRKHLTFTKLSRKLATPPSNIEVGYKYPPPQCMPDEYRQDNTVAAYRAFYIGDKPFAKWNKGRPAPDWYKEKVA